MKQCYQVDYGLLQLRKTPAMPRLATKESSTNTRQDSITEALLYLALCMIELACRPKRDMYDQNPTGLLHTNTCPCARRAHHALFDHVTEVWRPQIVRQRHRTSSLRSVPSQGRTMSGPKCHKLSFCRAEHHGLAGEVE